MIERDPLHVLHEQDKELIWSLRYECREHFPRSLPKVLGCVHWDDYIEVAMVRIIVPLALLSVMVWCMTVLSRVKA